MASGTVPVYMGAPNIAEYVPDGSIINAADFESTADLAAHLKECMQDNEVYNKYQAWREKPLPDWFVEKFRFTHVSTECRTCRYLLAKQLNKQWNHKAQNFIGAAKKEGGEAAALEEEGGEAATALEEGGEAAAAEDKEEEGGEAAAAEVVAAPLTLVTGATSGFFGALRNFVGSAHFWAPHTTVLVYNLGLTAEQCAAVRTWKNVQLQWEQGIPASLPAHVHAGKQYAWKPIAIQDALKGFDTVLWLDAGCDLRAPLTGTRATTHTPATAHMRARFEQLAAASYSSSIQQH